MEKMLPSSVEAEQGVIGSILIDPDAMDVIAGKVSAHDFWRDAHRTIFEAIERLHAQRIPADFITLCNELESRPACGRNAQASNQLGDVGGASYLTSLLNRVPTSGNIEYYANIVAEKGQLRDAIHASSQFVAEAYAEEFPVAELLAKYEQQLFQITQRLQRGNDFTSTETIVSERISRFEYLHQHRGAIIGVPTGLSPLDQITGGLQRSDLIVLAARPGVGKTSLALTIAHNAAVKYRQSVAIFSLEMSKGQLGDRLLSMDAGIDQQRLRTGWIEEDEWAQLVCSGDRIAEAPIWIDDTCGITHVELRSKARRLQMEHGVDLIIVDYLQLMQAGSGKKYENRVQEVSEISRNLKGLARELNVPVLALSQLSRSVENRQSKVPQLSDLTESGSIEQDADVVGFIYRDEMYNPESESKGTAELIIAKHRNGPVGEISLRFDPTRTQFKDMA